MQTERASNPHQNGLFFHYMLDEKHQIVYKENYSLE